MQTSRTPLAYRPAMSRFLWKLSLTFSSIRTQTEQLCSLSVYRDPDSTPLRLRKESAAWRLKRKSFTFSPCRARRKVGPPSFLFSFLSLFSPPCSPTSPIPQLDTAHVCVCVWRGTINEHLMFSETCLLIPYLRLEHYLRLNHQESLSDIVVCLQRKLKNPYKLKKRKNSLDSGSYWSRYFLIKFSHQSGSTNNILIK